MLKHNDINPLSVFGLRRVDYCPPHFATVVFDLTAHEKVITDWIWENLDGRFFYGEHYSESATGSVSSQKMVAFESVGEASYFALVLDTINKYDNVIY